MTTKTPFEEFRSVMQADSRTASYSKDDLRQIYDRLVAKVAERAEKERHKAERAHRHKIDDLRSRIKKLSPAVRIDDSWEQVRARLEQYDEYRDLESEELRRSAFEKHIRRLKEKEEDDRRSKERDRDHRSNGHASKRHRSATPEADAYEADRRKAQAARERTYGKRGIPGVSPPPSRSSRDWDGDHYSGGGRGDSRDGRKVSSSNHYERDRRERETERERSYLSRADPKERTTVLEYGDEEGSVGGEKERAGSGRRRRDSDVESTRSSKVSLHPVRW
jgi:pre-mRNA-processing factor 40